MRRGRLLAVCVAIATLSVGVTATTVNAAFGGLATYVCHGGVNTTQNPQGPHTQTLSSSGEVHCPPPKADGVVDPGASQRTTTGPHWTPGAPPPRPTFPDNGAPCSYPFTSGVTLDAPGPTRQAHWTLPDTGAPTSVALEDGASLPPPPAGLIVPTRAARVAGDLALYMRYTYTGTYDGTSWECHGQWKEKDAGNPCWGDETYGPVGHCFYTEPIGVVAAVLPAPPAPATLKPVVDGLGSANKTVTAGQVASSPADLTRQYVNLPSCWWLTQVVPSESYVVYVDGPPNASGRALTYVYKVTAGLRSVHWDYGDGTTFDGTAGTPYGPGSCSNPHTYTRVSTSGSPGAVPCPATYPHPSTDDACYTVQASETYSVSVTAYWDDNNPNRTEPWPTWELQPFTITTAPAAVRVLQVEGIPVTN